MYYLTDIERNVVLVALDHMEEHLDAIKHDHHIFNHQVYLKRVKALRTARAKIQKQV